MDYFDLNNVPQNAIYSYIPVGGSVYPNLRHGIIFRIPATGDFNIERLANQIDGMKFVIEVYNQDDEELTLSFDNDYRSTDLGLLAPVDLSSDGVVAYEVICRLGLMFVYDKPGIVDNYIRNPLNGFILLNPETGEPLLNRQS